MGEPAQGLRWGVERRLEFIEFRLYWEGGINRGELTSFFGVSVPQASKDLSQYQEIAPGNMEYDKSEKRYFTSAEFKPRLIAPDSDQYLSQLRAVADDGMRPEGIWLSNTPEADLMPIPHRRVEPKVLRSILGAIRKGKATEIVYQSMNPKRPDPETRGISPHAFGHDGFRWHVRAFCHIDKKFKDFLLSRCLECKITGSAEATPDDDQLWQEFIDLRLKPNPKLSKAQQRVIASDYHMEDNELRLRVRKALLYYFNKRLRLDVAEALDRPQEAPIVVANKAAFEKALICAQS